MPGPAPRTVLILGGTAGARALAETLATRPDIRVVTSLAGRTRIPQRPPGEVRVGGFAGPDGLAHYLTNNDVIALIDSTHPFARQISKNARLACAAAGVPLLTVARPAWSRREGDNWSMVADEQSAAAAVPAGARALLALGSQRLEAFRNRDDVTFFVRMVDPPREPLPVAASSVIVGRPSRDVAAETALLVEHQISHIVCRNSGGEASYAKIEAARNLGLPVIMIDQPAAPDGETVSSLEDAVRWLDALLERSAGA